MKSFYDQVAPAELILQDLRVLYSYEHLDTSEKIQELIFMQSLEGRSHNGSGVFTKRPYVNTNMDDIVKALGYDAAGVKRERQNLIDGIVDFVRDTLNGERHEKLVNSSGEPLLGIPFFKDRKVNARDVVRGIYMGGLRDSVEIRSEAEARYKVRIGYGECYVVSVGKMTEMQLDGQRLAHEEHADEIPRFKEAGLIVGDEREGAGITDGGDLRYYYIRHRLGPGHSDDAAIVMAGLLYNVDVALGVFLADAIDTLEKYAPVFKDQDQELSYFIARGFRELGITRDDVLELTYLAAIPEMEEEFVPDSSLRYLIALDPRSDSTALRTHLCFVERKPVSEILLSFKRILSTDFYEYVKRRLMNLKRFDGLTIPELTLDQLSRAVGEFAQNKKFLVVPKGMSLSEVIKKFKETKSEIVIVTGKNGQVVGTLSATDLIYLSREKN